MKRTKFNYHDLNSSEKGTITKIEHEVHVILTSMKLDAYEVGKLLCKAKDVLPHGSFQDWIRQTFADDLPYSTANLYMKIYKTFKGKPSMVKEIPSQYLTVFTQNQFPDEALDLIQTSMLTNGSDSIERWQFQSIQRFFDFMKKGVVGGNKFLKQVDKIIKSADEKEWEQLKNKNKYRKNRNKRRPLYFGLSDLLKRLDSAIEQAQEMAGLFPFDPDNPEHKKVIKQIHKIIAKFQKLEIELQGGQGLLKPVSTKNGDQYSNI